MQQSDCITYKTSFGRDEAIVKELKSMKRSADTMGKSVSVLEAQKVGTSPTFVSNPPEDLATIRNT
jgi:hypothetical protein